MSHKRGHDKLASKKQQAHILAWLTPTLPGSNSAYCQRNQLFSYFLRKYRRVRRKYMLRRAKELALSKRWALRHYY